MVEKLNLEQLRHSVGLERYELANEAGVSTRFIQEAESCSVPMAQAKIEKVLKVLSKHHGRPILVHDVRDLKII